MLSKRRFLLLLSLTLAIAPCVEAQPVENWEPQKIGTNPDASYPFNVSPDGKWLALNDGKRLVICDLATGHEKFHVRYRKKSDDWRDWSVAALLFGPQSDRIYATFSRGAGVEEFKAQCFSMEGKSLQKLATLRLDQDIAVELTSALRLDNEQNLRLLGGPREISWNLKTGVVKLLTHPEWPEDFIIKVVSQDGEQFYGFDWISAFGSGKTRTGRLDERVHIPKDEQFFEEVRFSSLGTYVLADTGYSWRVFERKTGRNVWSFDTPDLSKKNWFIPDNEQEIFVVTKKNWEVRDLKTGKFLRTLPMVPNLGYEGTFFSPDGAILYSLDAKNTLFRQRTR